MRNGHIAKLLQPLAALLLLVQKLLAPARVAGVQLGQHILAEGLERFARENAFADGGLNGDFWSEVSRLGERGETSTYQTFAGQYIP